MTQLPKTGIEYPYMRDRPKFINNHKDFEPCYSYNVNIFFLKY